MKFLNIYEDVKAEEYKGETVKHWAVPFDDCLNPYVLEFNLKMHESMNTIKEYQNVYILDKKCYYVNIKDPVKCINRSRGVENMEYRERNQVINYLLKCYYEQHQQQAKEVRTYFDFDPTQLSGTIENPLKAKICINIKNFSGECIYTRIEKFSEMGE